MSLPESKNQIVLITGVNGYIASTTAAAFLDAGYSVRGTVRSKSSADALLAALSPFVAANRVEIVEVPDIIAPGAFDSAVKGVHAIAHMASPVQAHFDDPEPIIRTAVQSTVSILDSALAYSSPSLKSVVLTSSIAAVLGSKTPPYTYTELDWNDVSEDLCAKLGKDTPSMQIYVASKAAGEKAFWKWVEEHKPPFSTTAINPTFVGGPPAVLPDSPEKIHATARDVYTVLSGAPIPPAFGGSGSFVDVRDVAALHVFGVEHPEQADKQRYIAAAARGNGQAIADILRKAYPDRKIAVGTPGEGYEPGYGFAEGEIVIDGSKAVRDSGREWTPYEKSILDAAKVFEKFL